jgi:nucleoredoxin
MFSAYYNFQQRTFEKKLLLQLEKIIIMASIRTETLIKADGSKVLGSEALAEKSIVCLYFSAHWCPPCRGFTPVLKDFYEEAKEQGVEIIFISSDEDSNAMMSYMKESHGDWYAFEHGNLKKELSEKYNVRGIPTLVVLKGDGTLISANGRGDVQSKGPGALKEWM